MYRALRWFLYAIGLLLIVLLGAVGFLQTAPGKRVLADQLSSLLSTPESAIEIADIEGSVPLDMRIGRFQLSDADGVWLNVDGVIFDWSPSALIGGRIQVDEVGADRIEILRAPLGDDAPAPVSDEPFRLPELPKSLPPITVERLAVPEIVLQAPVLGEAASFALEGSLRADDSGEQVTADLALERTDKPTASISLAATAGLDPPTLDLVLKGGESGGVIAGLLDRPDVGRTNISLEGRGPLDNWSGQLRADAEGLAAVEADLGLALTDQPRVTIDGALEPAPGMLPDDIAALIGERLSLDLDVVQTKAQAIDLRKARITVPVATLEAEGAVDFDAGGLRLKSRLSAADLAPLSTLAQASLSGAALAELEVGGTVSAPDGTLDLKIDKVAFDEMSASAIETAIRFGTIEPLASDRPSFDLAIDGQATGLSIPGAVLPDPDVGWQAKLAVPLEGEIAIEGITIETAGSSLTAEGGIDPQALEGRIDLALNAPALERLAKPYGQPLAGQALIKAAIQLADQATSIGVDLDASLAELSGLPPGAAELVGDAASLQAKLALDGSRTLDLQALTIDGAHIGVAGKAVIGLDRETIDGTLTAALPDLAVLEPLIPGGTKGAVNLEADLGGDFTAPTADLKVTTKDLALAGEPLSALAIRANGKDLIAEPNGDLEIDVNARETPATLALNYRLAGNMLDLENIALTAPETDIGGDLAIMLDNSLIEGALEGRIGNLGALEPLLQQALGGSVDIKTTLRPDGDRQNARLNLQARDVRGDFGRISTVDLDASVADAMNAPNLDAKTSITGFKQGTTEIDALTLLANGDSGALDFELNVAGQAIEPLELASAGNVAFADGLSLGVKRLTGSFAGEALRLEKPLTLRQDDGTIRLADLDLRFGEARLTGDVDIGKTDARGTVDLTSLPLKWSEVFGGPQLSGDAGLDIDLSGSVTSPKVVAALTVDGKISKDIAPSEPPLNITLTALLDRGRLAANLKGEGLTNKPITATASLPARLTLSPFAFDMPKDGALEGRIDAELLLARLADILALDDQELKGTLLADIAIGGTLGEPTVKGPVKLEGGGYENGFTGTDIRDLTMSALASSERIEITELSGRTGTKRGTLSSKGWLQLDAGGNFPLSVSLRLDDARLVNRDDVDARISGDIAMTGNLERAEVNGDLTVERAEISIPDGGGPNLPEIEVTEVNGRFVNPPEDESAAVKEKPFDPSLNVNIALPNKIYVRGRGLESEWQGNLSITGPASNPVIVGSLNIKKGYFDFLDKRFELELGEITFGGGTPPNPIIALEAVAEDDDFKAIIKLNGPADDPQLVLSSEPVLPEDEILARLLFNRQLSEIGAVEAAKLALAVNRLRGGGGFDAFGEIRNILKIDTLDVVSDEEGESTVKAGKYLNDDVYVEVEKGAGEQSGRARVEVELLPNIALEADTSEDANSGVGLKWKFNY